MGTNNVIPRACQNCRVRKIRCNRDVPCSNCVTSSLACQPVGQPSSKRTLAEKPSSRNPPTDDTLLERIASLEQSLAAVIAQQGAKSEEPTEKDRSSQKVESTHHVPLANRTVPFEGVPSFDRQAYMASQIPELTSPETAKSPSVMDELNVLRSVIHEQKPVGSASDPQSSNHLQMELVPSSFVLELLRVLRETQSLLFLFHAVHDLAQLESLCQRIYFPVNPLTTGELTVFHGMLYFAIWELEYTPRPGLHIDDIQRYRDVCWANFQAGFDSHELAAIPTYENTLALSMAALDAQMKGKLALQWNLISAAAKHCLALGYHRNDTLAQLPFPKAESRRRLFWHVYMSDSSLCLSLGRAPIIQDYDVDVQPVTVSEDPKRAPWDKSFQAFVQFSPIQGRIYRKLYSPMARCTSLADRQAIVARLAAQLTQWYADWQKVDYSGAYHSQIFRTTFAAVDVTYYSVLTLLYRGATASDAIVDISPDCFQAAKQGLEAHLEFYPEAVSRGKDAVSTYAIWILLYTSFTPYIVTFLHCIGSSDPADLALLQKVVATLESIASIINGCMRQYELCKALHRTAEAFVESRIMDMGRKEPQLERALNLSLQNPLLEEYDWSCFQTTLDGWNG